MILSIPRRLQRSLDKNGVGGTLLIVIKVILRVHIILFKSLKKQPVSDFDAKYGISTDKDVELASLSIGYDSWASGVKYQASCSNLFLEMVSKLPVNFKDYAFFDFGSGKGRVLIAAAEVGFGKIEGIEFSEELHKTCEQNIDIYKQGKGTVNGSLNCVLEDATQYVLPIQPSVYYFYNPFEKDVMEKVVANIINASSQVSRDCYVLYNHPVYSNIFDKHQAFELIGSTDDYKIWKC